MLANGLYITQEKLKFVETLFEEADLELISKREDLISKLRDDIDKAKAGIDNLMPAISAIRELQSRTDTISFIKVYLSCTLYNYLLLSV